MAQDPGIGKKIDPALRLPDRDAIHVAVLPAIAGEVLAAGERVLLRDGRAFEASPAAWVGVVDPFIVGTVDKGERFWLFMLPGTVQGLRHDWTHPAVDSRALTADQVRRAAWLAPVPLLGPDRNGSAFPTGIAEGAALQRLEKEGLPVDEGSIPPGLTFRSALGTMVVREQPDGSLRAFLEPGTSAAGDSAARSPAQPSDEDLGYGPCCI